MSTIDDVRERSLDRRADLRRWLVVRRQWDDFRGSLVGRALRTADVLLRAIGLAGESSSLAALWFARVYRPRDVDVDDVRRRLRDRDRARRAARARLHGGDV